MVTGTGMETGNMAEMEIKTEAGTELTGFMASSKAGHDKNTVYVIIREDAEYVYLADGKTKTLMKPKKKNKKHIQIIKKCPDAGFAGRVIAGQTDDTEIKKALEQYRASMIK